MFEQGQDKTITNPYLSDNSRIAVIGGGPAGSLFSFFLLNLAERIDVDLRIDIFEPRNFSTPGPVGCNMCGGIISESLVQTLATEGIDLPESVIQRGIESYALHMDVGSVLIKTPLEEKRIAAVYRGSGPRGIKEVKLESFDNFLLNLAKNKGANIISSRVDELKWKEGKPEIKTKEGTTQIYDLLVVATGVNTSFLKLFEDSDFGYESPKTTKTFICEYNLEKKTIEEYLGNSMHTFLLNLPNLEFAAIVPKGDYATVCMLGHEINKDLVHAFLENPPVKQLLPKGWEIEKRACQCMPRMNIKGSKKPFGNRIVFIGDSGVSRLYKDGIGAAYRTAKAAAVTAIFNGISNQDFETRYQPACRKIERDNTIGKFIFFIVGQIQKIRLTRRAILRMVTKEQKRKKSRLRMSMVLWDMFTGSAPYEDILIRTFHPFFWGGLIWNILAVLWPFKKKLKIRRTGTNG